MKYRKLMLQLFAEDPTPAPTPGESEVTEPKPGDPTPPAPQLKYTDDDVDKLINQKFAEWQKKQQAAVDEAKKLEKMNAEQKAQYEKEQLEKQLEEYKRKETLHDMTKTARNMLSESGITASDELLSMMVSTDAEQTKAAIDSFKALFKESVENAVKERLRGTTPTAGTDKGGGTLSEIDKRIRKYEI